VFIFFSGFLTAVQWRICPDRKPNNSFESVSKSTKTIIFLQFATKQSMPLLERRVKTYLRASMLKKAPGIVRVMENLESHGILEFDFPGLESHGN